MDLISNGIQQIIKSRGEIEINASELFMINAKGKATAIKITQHKSPQIISHKRRHKPPRIPRAHLLRPSKKLFIETGSGERE